MIYSKVLSVGKKKKHPHISSFAESWKLNLNDASDFIFLPS